MASQLPRNAHRLEVPYGYGAVDTARCKVVALAIESQHGRMARSDGVGDALRIILQQVVVGQQQVHGCDYRSIDRAISDWYILKRKRICQQ